jgi:hypothetical protein
MPTVPEPGRDSSGTSLVALRGLHGWRRWMGSWKRHTSPAPPSTARGHLRASHLTPTPAGHRFPRRIRLPSRPRPRPAPSLKGSVAPAVEGADRTAEPARGAAGRTAGQAPDGPADRTAWSAVGSEAPAPCAPRRGRRRGRRAQAGRRHWRRVGRRPGRRHDRNHRGRVDTGASRQRGLHRRREGRVGHRGRAGGLGRVHRDRGHGAPATSGGSVSASHSGVAVAIDTARQVVDELTGKTI